MAEQTGIGWCDHSWSPWIGCQAVSAACDYCYAEELTNRWGGDFSVRRRTSPTYWKQIATWNRKAQAAGVNATVFPSMCDPFDNKADPIWRADMWDQIRFNTHLTFLLLTKRPQCIPAMLPADWRDGYGYPNVWLGITAETQAEYDRRWPYLAAVNVDDWACRFVSYEPALGPLRITEHISKPDWLICGGESGRNARPMHPAWARSIRDQCADAGVPFFFKQWGEWTSEGLGEDRPEFLRLRLGDRAHVFPDGQQVGKVGKKAAGNLLDGKQHLEIPNYG